MAKPARSGWEEIEQRVREWIKELENMLNPKMPERARVPVPVRVRPDNQRPPQ
jgi:hypothetical protein